MESVCKAFVVRMSCVVGNGLTERLFGFLIHLLILRHFPILERKRERLRNEMVDGMTLNFSVLSVRSGLFVFYGIDA